MSSTFFYDSDDERDDFDIEQQQIRQFQRNLLSTSIESSEDDDEGIIDGTKIPSSTKLKTRVKHSFLDISTSSMSNQDEFDDDNDIEQNPFEILSKTIDIENRKIKSSKKKNLGVLKTRKVLETNDIYEQDENIDKTKIRKPTKAAVLETERKMQQLSRSEHLVLPTFIPKQLETWHALEKRSRQELMNEIRAKNPSFTPQDPELPELPQIDIESTAATTLSDLTKLIEEQPVKTTNKLDKFSRFLNPDLLKKKPTISNLNQQSDTMIDLTNTKKLPTIKPNINISFDGTKSPSSTKRLLDIQKQLGIRMQAKRTAMLAENNINISNEIEDEEDIDDEDSMDTTNEERLSNIDKEEDEEEIKDVLTDDEEEEMVEEPEEEEEEEIENTEPAKDSERPSLKTILTRLESSSESAQIQPPPEQNGQTEWFDSACPAQFDSELEMLCSGAFGGDNIIPPSQNIPRHEPVVFSPLPSTQPEEEEEDIEIRRPKVRQLVDDDDEESEQINSGSNDIEQEEDEDNEELIDYKKQLFEIEAEESGSDIDEKDKDNEENDSDEDDEPDEELQKFIDTTAMEMDDDEIDNLAKVHLKIKAKEDEHQLKLLKEQYLDFDGDDDGRRIKISKTADDDEEEEDDDPDYNSENDDDEEEEEEEEEDEQSNLAKRMSELERQRSLQDTQAEELHLDEDLDNIGQHSSMFQKGLALKQKKIQTTTTSHIEISTNTKKSRTLTLSSSLLAKRFSSTLLAPMNRNQISISNTNQTTETTKKQHNPRRHVFTTNENQNPVQTSGEKRPNSAEKSPKTNIKRFKQSTTTIVTKTKETSTSVFSALAFSNPKP